MSELLHSEFKLEPIFNSPVFPIPPAFKEDESLDHFLITKYIKFLEENDATCLMTTAGTSGYDILSIVEILEFNKNIILKTSENTKIIVGVPAYNLRHAKGFVETLESSLEQRNISEQKQENIFYMFLFPERYYNDDQVVDYFQECAEFADSFGRRCLFHGKPMISARGGEKVNFNAQLINQIASMPNMIGMKEETSTVEEAAKIVADIEANFDIIVAGGSMSRFEKLKSVGATSFLTGIGSLYPTIPLEYFKLKNKSETVFYLEQEKEFFSIFMNIGWHLALRTALYSIRYKNPFTRKPFPRASDKQLCLINKLMLSKEIGWPFEHKEND